jgi:hypothetical protein
MKKYRPLFICLTLAGAVIAHAQQVAFESVRIAETLADSALPELEKAIPVLISGLESQLKAGGLQERTARLFGEELRRALNRDNLARVLSQSLSEKLTADEMRQLNTFLLTSTGQKYLQLNRESTSAKHWRPLVRQACEVVIPRSEAADRSKIADLCRQL